MGSLCANDIFRLYTPIVAVRNNFGWLSVSVSLVLLLLFSLVMPKRFSCSLNLPTSHTSFITHITACTRCSANIQIQTSKHRHFDIQHTHTLRESDAHTDQAHKDQILTFLSILQNISGGIFIYWVLYFSLLHSVVVVALYAVFRTHLLCKGMQFVCLLRLACILHALHMKLNVYRYIYILIDM